MDKPTKPTNLMPRSFGGVKNNFSNSLQTSGYEDGVPAIYGGDNLNYQLDATGKELDYCETICDFINNIPIGKTITVDNNNKLVYEDLSQQQEGANKDLSNLTVTGEAHFQAPLISGTNIKTINYSSILGSGNLSIQGGHTWCTTVPTTSSSASSTHPSVVIENYVNGTSWYRVYSDKWCEQGGKFDGSSNARKTVSLLKSYKDTGYCIYCTVYADITSGNLTAAGVDNPDTTISSFVLYNSQWGYASRGGFWATAGFIN